MHEGRVELERGSSSQGACRVNRLVEEVMGMKEELQGAKA